jgi:DNA (cytosine-5)-methyltransferase 1
MNHIDLFTGIMGFSLAAHRAGWKTVAVSEIEPYCCELIKLRMPGVPNLGDIKNYEEWEIDEPIGIITAGFPCQPVSQAGKRRGKEDDRWLWHETLAVVKRFKPHYFIGENVAGLITMGLDEVCTSLEDAGYSVQPVIIPACAKNAPHRRDRVWIIAYSGHRDAEGKSHNGRVEEPIRQEDAVEPERSVGCDTEGVVANSEGSHARQLGGELGGEQEQSDSQTIRRRLQHESGRPSEVITDPKLQYDDVRGYGASPVCRERSESTEVQGRETDSDSDSTRPQGLRSERNCQGSDRLHDWENTGWERNWAEVATELCRMDDGLPGELDGLNESGKFIGTRVNRLKGLGNAIVSQIAYEIMLAINKANK